MKKRRTIKEVYPQIYTDYKNGMTIIELSEKYDFKPNSIRLYFNKQGINFSNAIKFSEQELNSIIFDYQNGLRPFELAKKYQRNSASIIGKLKEIGIYNNSNYRFTDEDIEFLKIYYPLGDWDLIEKRFTNTNRQSIHTKMYKLGISADKYFNEKNWTKAELQILKENYVYGDIEKLLKLLPNRTYKSITTKARRIGLSTRTCWTNKEDSIIKHFYHLKTVDEMMELLPNRTHTSIIEHARQLNLVSICKYTKEETQYIINNWHQMSDEEIAIVLNKPYKGIKAKRLSLGLLKIKEESSYNSLSEYVRRNNLDWKEKSMINCKYKCVLTGNRFNDIHHIYGLNLILNETLDELNIDVKPTMDDYTEEELDDILDIFRIKQSEYPLGVCLCKEVHILFHNKYGYGNNTEEQWEEFVNDFKLGKYEKNVA